MSTNTMQPSSAIDLCSDCRLDPCACSYIAKLRPAGELAHLREAALELRECRRIRTADRLARDPVQDRSSHITERSSCV
jgi:hypothetical protein